MIEKDIRQISTCSSRAVSISLYRRQQSIFLAYYFLIKTRASNI